MLLQWYRHTLQHAPIPNMTDPAVTPPEPARRSAPEHFLNRELAALAFNRRVLAQAADDAVPLLERLRFICIVSSNLDEFFEIRAAGLKEQIKLGSHHAGNDGLSPQETFRLVSEEAHRLVAEQYALLNQVILPLLAQHGIEFLRRTKWTPQQQAWVRDYFFNEVMPILTPVGLDPSHPFPRVLNKSLNFAVELEGRDAFGRSSALCHRPGAASAAARDSPATGADRAG